MSGIIGEFDGVPDIIVDLRIRTVDQGGIAHHVLDDRDVVFQQRVAAAILVSVELETIALDRVITSIWVSGLESHVRAAIGRVDRVGAFVFVKHEDKAVCAPGAVVDLISEIDFPDPGCELIVSKGCGSEI